MAMNSRIVQLAIIDSIYVYLLLNKAPETLQAISDTELALKSKKY